MKPLNDRLALEPGFRFAVSLAAMIHLFFGAAWTWTFGFTSYRSHVAFIFLPLGIACLCLGISLLLMRRWAILISIPISALFGVASLWVAFVTHYWVGWGGAAACLYYAIAIARRGLRDDIEGNTTEPDAKGK